MTLSDPHKEHYLGIKLEYGGSDLFNPDVGSIDDTPSVIYLTDYTSDQTILSDAYSSFPTIEVVLGKTSGSFDENETKIDVPRAAIPDELTKGVHAPVRVTIYEYLGGDSGGEVAPIFKGMIHRTVRDVGGREGTDRLVCFTRKRQLRRKLGVPADHQCVWQLFGTGCRTVNVDTGPPGNPTATGFQGPAAQDDMSSPTVVAINGTTVSVEDLKDVGLLRGDLWSQGFLEYRGLRIKIRDWDLNNTVAAGGGLVDTTFELVREPPASWLNKTMRAVTGCSKFIEECRLRHDNEDNFNGVGYSILPYNPLIESP